MSDRLRDERLAEIAGDCFFPPRVPFELGEVPRMARELIERRAAQAAMQEKIHQLEQRCFALSAVAAAAVQAVEIQLEHEEAGR